MATVNQTTLTLAAFLELPETEPYTDYYDGEQHKKVSPTFRHARLASVPCERTNAFARPRHLGVALAEFRCTFGGLSVVPDVCFFQLSKIPLGPEGKPLATFDGVAPDLVVEILSPDQRQLAVQRKVLACLKAGTPVGWRFIPDRTSVTVFHPSVAPQERSGSDLLSLQQALPGFSVTVEQLYRDVWPL